MKDCEFCQELQALPGNRFQEIYRDIVDSRIVAQTSHFVAMPTIGQIFPGTTLILPRKHEETCAGLSVALRQELLALTFKVMATVTHFGEPTFFEHGATKCTGGGCGIYHAHLHVVPLPERTHPKALFPQHVGSATNLGSALSALHACDHYLLIGNDEGVVFADVRELPFIPASQYFRRQLVEQFGVWKSWDWRDSVGPEADVLATITAFGVQDVSQRSSHPT